jgi:hypothetical protein
VAPLVSKEQVMAEVPESIIKECKERFGDEIYFVFNQHKERFVAKVRDANEPDCTFDLFYVEDELRRFRGITMEDVYRCERARVIDPEAKAKAKQELEAKLAAERKAAMKPKTSQKKEIILDIANTLSTNPIAARAFASDAKKKYSKLKTTTRGNKTTIGG